MTTTHLLRTVSTYWFLLAARLMKGRGNKHRAWGRWRRLNAFGGNTCPDDLSGLCSSTCQWLQWWWEGGPGKTAHLFKVTRLISGRARRRSSTSRCAGSHSSLQNLIKVQSSRTPVSPERLVLPQPCRSSPGWGCRAAESSALSQLWIVSPNLSLPAVTLLPPLELQCHAQC